MQRKQKINVDAILTSDWHIMEHTPPCRTDDFLETELNKVKQIRKLQKKYDCPVFHAGDLFEKARPSLYLVKRLMEVLPSNFNTILGNHDLVTHNIELYDKSAIALIEGFNKLNLLSGKHYNQKQYEYIDFNDRKILITHEMIWQGKEPWPGCTDPEINELFKIYPEPDLILTGHNHKTIIAEKDDRLIINPGSLTRHKADQIKHDPCVFLYDSSINKAIPAYLKIEESKNKQLQKFIDNLKTTKVKEISFENNLEILLKQNNIPSKIEQIIKEWMECTQ